MNGEATLRRAPPAGPARIGPPRHSVYGPHWEPARGPERPPASGRRRGPIADEAARTAAADPAQRLLQLTEELGRLAGEIAEGAKAAVAQLDSTAVRARIRARRRRAAELGPDLFADPVWDMMLDLLAARLEGRSVSTSSLCIAAGVPGTTALRWIRQAVDRGLFMRVADPRDGRGVLIELSDDTAERLLVLLAPALSF